MNTNYAIDMFFKKILLKHTVKSNDDIINMTYLKVDSNADNEDENVLIKIQKM